MSPIVVRSSCQRVGSETEGSGLGRSPSPNLWKAQWVAALRHRRHRASLHAALVSCFFASALGGCKGGDETAQEGTHPRDSAVFNDTDGSPRQCAGLWSTSNFILPAYLVRGPYTPYTLADLLGASRDRQQLMYPRGDVCAQHIAARLTDLCRSGLCRTSNARCAYAAEEAFWAPIDLEYTHACHICGDGFCSRLEAQHTYGRDGGPLACPDDCTCGNGICEPERGENPYTCPGDCPSACGDGVCTGGEICATCPDDEVDCDQCATERAATGTISNACSSCFGALGTRLAPPPCTSCPQDCCRSACGDGVCVREEGETPESCPQDCAVTSCGDGLCLGLETPASCPQDCARVTPSCLPGGEGRQTRAVGCPTPNNCLICPWACDPRATCGDGVCSTCEMWTCGVDCQRTGFGLCTIGNGGERICPERYCGDGVCDGPVENFLTCPQDCPVPSVQEERCGDGVCTLSDFLRGCADQDCTEADAAAYCGDGYCMPGETGEQDPRRRQAGEFYCPEDCAPPARPCEPITGSCTANGTQCVRVLMDSPLLEAQRSWRTAVARCDDGCEVLEVCPDDLCAQDGERAFCADCGRRSPAGLCLHDHSARCIDDQTLSVCRPDVAAPDIPACSLRSALHCPGGCLNNRCLPCPQDAQCPPGSRCEPSSGQCIADHDCTGGECTYHCQQHCATCGNGQCEPFETAATCPEDCACTDRCNHREQDDNDAFWCPSAYAACRCGNGVCEAWEADGRYPCPEDCG